MVIYKRVHQKEQRRAREVVEETIGRGLQSRRRSRSRKSKSAVSEYKDFRDQTYRRKTYQSKISKRFDFGKAF